MPQDNPEVIIEGALWYSIITTYAKLFTDSLHKSSKLEKKDIFNLLDETIDEQYKMHKELIHQRNNFVAHRGSSISDRSLVFVKTPKTLDVSKATIEVKTVRAYGNGVEYFANCIQLFQKIFSIVDEKMSSSSEKVGKMLTGKPLSFFDRYQV